ncbi:oligosaccharide flippase family protein [Candidatus Daviesbacteria bacterium]|nr:oligosaccharide flippase family protein [Candidatus Daviesbacteria bacterium]
MYKLVKITQQTLWQLVGKAVTSFSTLLILSFITRFYGEVGTGVLTLVLAYLGFFTIAVDLGFNAYLMPQLLENYQLVWRKLFGLRILVAVFLAVIAIFGIFFFPNYDPLVYQLVLIGAAGALAQPAFFITANAIFQSKLRYDLSIISSSLGSLVTLILVILVVYNRLPLQFVMAGYLLGWIITAFIALILAGKFIHQLSPVFDPNFIKRVFKGAWPIALTLLLNVFYFRADIFLLSFLKPIGDVGIYNLSYSIFQSALVLPTFIMNGYYPLMIQSFKMGKTAFFGQLKQASLGMLGLGVLGILATFVLGSFIIFAITGGTGFLGAAESLKILSLGYPAYFMSALLMWTLVVIKKYKAMVFIYLIGLVFNVCINIIFIPLYSFIATSWITGLSEYLVLALQIIALALVSKRSWIVDKKAVI